jgi:hypothetical protein
MGNLRDIFGVVPNTSVHRASIAVHVDKLSNQHSGVSGRIKVGCFLERENI